MKLNHLNLTVTHVPEAREFLEKHFGLRSMSGKNNLALLTDDGGMVLTLTSLKVANESEVRYPATFHVGFSQESEKRVNEINRRLKEDGFGVPPPSCQHGARTFYLQAPGGFTIEVLSALGEERPH